MSASKNVAAARAYLTAIERGATGNELAAFFTEDVVQQEFPNRLMPNGATRNLVQILEGAERGQAILSSQRYEVLNAIESGETVVLEVRWTGTMAVAVAGLPAGGEMRARFAVFLDYRSGKIARQRNYDCFDPW
ncbi:MAG TPA: nuclear transport factor 2 family protein [Gemmatimonadaceae bacterium]|nr:nuclear transport factor 2 family protein [Gemmatimonadaceae bacterium]